MFRFSNRSIPVLAILGLILILSAGACRTKGQAVPTEEEVLTEEEAAAAEAEAKEAAVKPAPPKVTEEIYIEITARSVLIRQKYAEDPAMGEKEVEALLEKTELTLADLKEYENKIGLIKVDLLQSKIQEKIQKLLLEYQK
jgi:hypothetical protein